MKLITLFIFCLVLGLSFFITNCQTGVKKDDSIKTELDSLTYSTEVINLKVDSVGLIYDMGGFNHSFISSINEEKSTTHIKVYDIAFSGEIFTQCLESEQIQIVVEKTINQTKKKEGLRLLFRKGFDSVNGVFLLQYPDITGFPKTLSYELNL